VTIHAVDEADGLPYLVMQYVQGVSLQQRLDRDGSLAVREILRIGMQAAQGLAAAHAQGLVHRDIKPANILLENGVERVKITDFGLARAADDASDTQSGVVTGTPQYMAPEQARGEALDHRADLFSQGSVLYTMATGRAPFRAESTFAVLKRVCEDVPRPIREVNAEIPEWLAAIVARLHAKEPDERIPSALELADVLAHYLANLQNPGETPARQASNSEVGVAKRHPHQGSRALWVAAVAALLLLTGLGLSDATGVTHM
jgi:serine/threonine protein kinase